MSDAPPATPTDADRPTLAASTDRALTEARLREGERLVNGEVRWGPNDVY